VVADKTSWTAPSSLGTEDAVSGAWLEVGTSFSIGCNTHRPPRKEVRERYRAVKADTVYRSSI
jgi:hypothetical protein